MSEGPPSGLCHGVPVEGGLHLHDLKQCCGSGSASIVVGWIRIRIGTADPDPLPGGQK